jgi:hypothetical protein
MVIKLVSVWQNIRKMNISDSKLNLYFFPLVLSNQHQFGDCLSSKDVDCGGLWTSTSNWWVRCHRNFKWFQVLVVMTEIVTCDPNWCRFGKKQWERILLHQNSTYICFSWIKGRLGDCLSFKDVKVYELLLKVGDVGHNWNFKQFSSIGIP